MSGVKVKLWYVARCGLVDMKQCMTKLLMALCIAILMSQDSTYIASVIIAITGW